MFAVVDESGDTGRSPDSSRHLVVAGVVCSNLLCLHRLVTQARKKLHRRQRHVPEVKGVTIPPKVTRALLASLVQEDVEIYVAVLDKSTAGGVEDREELYRVTYAACVGHILARHPDLAIVTDQRYNAPAQFERFARAIRTAVAAPGVNLTITPADSLRQKAIQVADTVAWGFFQKYERGDDSLCQIMGIKTVAEVGIKKAGSTWGV